MNNTNITNDNYEIRVWITWTVQMNDDDKNRLKHTL